MMIAIVASLQSSLFFFFFLCFPFTFVNYPIVQLDGGSSNYVNFVRKFGSHTDKVSYIVAGLTKDATNVSINLDIYAIGKWK